MIYCYLKVCQHIKVCDEGITLDEISKAVNLQKPDKSPGEDGIVSEFYNHCPILPR
jgi:hypothetical protein